MFLCNPCHGVRFGTSIDDVHLARSQGPCESCRRPSICADCHCPPPEGERGDAKAKALQGAALIAEKVIAPITDIAKHVLREEFPDLYPHEIDRAMARVRTIIITGVDPRNDPNAMIDTSQVDFTAIQRMVEDGEASSVDDNPAG